MSENPPGVVLLNIPVTIFLFSLIWLKVWAEKLIMGGGEAENLLVRSFGALPSEMNNKVLTGSLLVP